MRVEQTSLRRICTIAVLIAGVHSARAQGASNRDAEVSRRVAVTLATVDPRRQAEPVVIYRGNGGRDDDVISLRRDAGPTELLRALVMLNAFRDTDGDKSTRARRLIPDGRIPAVMHDREFPAAINTVNRLRTAGLREVPRLGRVPAYVVYLPSSGMRQEERVRIARAR